MKSKMPIPLLSKETYGRTVLSIALKSRVLVTTLFIVWRMLANPYDTSAELNRPCLTETSDWSTTTEEATEHHWGRTLGRAVEKTIVWDGVYYVKIAECGYEYEHGHAFLPGFPLLMRFVARTFLSRFIPFMGLRATLALAGYLINGVSFILAAYCLFRLTESLLEDGLLALTAAALFCFNPASTFYSAVYSESLFALLSFSGLLCFVKGARWWSILLFGLSSGVRSNGVLHAGFFLFHAMHKAYNLAVCRRKFSAAGSAILRAMLQSFLVAAPFVAFQFYGYLHMCYIPSRTGLIRVARPWCSTSLPYLYGFVQSHYWNVGFLRYFQLKQLPNFLLASPMLILALCSVVTYAKQHPKLFLTLGLAAATTSSPSHAKVALLSKNEMSKYPYNRQEGPRKGTGIEGSLELPSNGFFSPAAVCFFIQLGFMTAVAVFVMHVQVATRFLSVSPPLYWFGAHVMINSKVRGTAGKLIWSCFLAYVSVGSLMFINFYPFT